MRVLHFGKYAYLRKGGMERHVEVLTQALAARGVDVTVLAYDPSGREAPRVVNGVHVEPVPTMAHLSSQSIAPSVLARASKLARRGPFDLVHQHWPDPLAHVAASFVPGKPLQIVSWHTDIVRQRVLGPIYRAVAPFLLAQPDAVIGATQTHLESQQIDRFAPVGRRHVIPFGIDVGSFKPTEAVLLRAQQLRKRYSNKPIVFSLGRHVYYKGFDVLIKAMARVPAILLLGGGGPLTPKLRQLASQLGERVRFVGVIPEAELPAYFHACNVFCLPSVAPTEAFGLAQAEAMACAKPVVNTALANGVNELAPHNLCALTAPPNDETALAHALQEILTNPARAAALGVAGFERLKAHFTVDAMAVETLALYESVVHQRQHELRSVKFHGAQSAQVRD